MAIQSNTNRIDYKPGSGVTLFPFSFAVYTKSDLKVYTVDSLHNIVQRTLDGAGAFDYQQTDANVPGGVAGGTVTFNTAPDSFTQVILIRVVPFTQSSSYDNFKGVDGKLGYEKVYDLLCMQIQQLQEQLNRVIKFDISTQNPPALLPSIADSNNFGGFLQFAADGSSVVVGAGNGGTINITYSTGAFAHRFVNQTSAGVTPWIVPANVNRIKVQLYGPGGGGGGGGGKNGGTFGGRGESGGAGAYVTATLNVTPGSTLQTIAGQGGSGGGTHAGAAGDPGTQASQNYSAIGTENTFTIGSFLKAMSGGFGQGGLAGAVGLTAPGIWHEAPPAPGDKASLVWVPDYTIIGGGSSGGIGGKGETGSAQSSGGGGGNGVVVIWY